MGKTCTEGSKHDSGKLRFDLLPAGVLREVAKVFDHGARKYAPDNWKLVEPVSRYRDALLRHWFAWREGEACDVESGLPHLAHVITNAMFLLWFEQKGVE